ncbi:MAG: hypothetical protein U0525_03180 [Patescibacteria group bacterium]
MKIHKHDPKKSLMENKFSQFALMLPVIAFTLLGVYYVITLILAK